MADELERDGVRGDLPLGLTAPRCPMDRDGHRGDFPSGECLPVRIEPLFLDLALCIPEPDLVSGSGVWVINVACFFSLLEMNIPEVHI